MTQTIPPHQFSMTRRDPSLNMARFYRVVLQPTLFGEVSIIRNWGRIGTRGQSMIETFTGPNEAVEAVSKLQQRKLRRGYR